jgi:hypothetical protein
VTLPVALGFDALLDPAQVAAGHHEVGGDDSRDVQSRGPGGGDVMSAARPIATRPSPTVEPPPTERGMRFGTLRAFFVLTFALGGRARSWSCPPTRSRRSSARSATPTRCSSWRCGRRVSSVSGWSGATTARRAFAASCGASRCGGCRRCGGRSWCSASPRSSTRVRRSRARSEIRSRPRRGTTCCRRWGSR